MDNELSLDDKMADIIHQLATMAMCVSEYEHEISVAKDEIFQLRQKLDELDKKKKTLKIV